MSNTWNEGYFTDVGYTYGYYREVSPVYQRFCLLIRGIDTSESENDDVAHCELGFGQGVSVNIHAASNPGTYYATDFNPEHAAHAQAMASAAGSKAVLLDDSFEQMLERNDLPMFNSISLHGIWTWVSRENHKIITEFARKYLKPGGILYNSYNCFPGWAPAYPLRQLFALYDRFTPNPGGVAGRVDGALKFTESLLQANPAYAKAVPGLDGRLKGIMAHDRHYLAHEYFNREWNCMYFTDVVDELSAAKLEYAGSAAPMDLVDEVNLSPEASAFLKKIDKPLLREQVRDYFINQQFRRDLYMRGIPRLNPGEQREKLLSTRFALLRLQETVPMTVMGALGEGKLHEDVYKPVLAALAAKEYTPKTLRELLKECPKLNYQQVLQALIVLTQATHVAPCQSETVSKKVRKTCEALNMHLYERAKYGNQIVNVASPVLGGGIIVDRIGQLFLLARHNKHPDPVLYAWEVLSFGGEVLIKDGAALVGAEANIAELKLRYEKFVKEQLAILKAVGVA